MHRYINRLTIACLLSQYYTRITDKWLENRNNRRNFIISALYRIDANVTKK